MSLVVFRRQRASHFTRNKKMKQHQQHGWRTPRCRKNFSGLHSLLCAHLVCFVLHDLSFKEVYFHIFLLHTIQFISTARKKKDPVFTCSKLHLFYSQLDKKKKNLCEITCSWSWRKNITVNPTRVAVVYLDKSVFTVHQFGIDAPSACCSFIRFCIGITSNAPSTTKRM